MNKGKTLTTQPLRTGEQIRDMINKLTPGRNRVMFILGIHSALRISDLVSLKCSDFDNGFMLIREKKTGKIKPFRLHPEVAKIVEDYIASFPRKWLFQSRQGDNHLSTGMARKIIKDAAEACGLKHISTHSMRKTFGYQAWKENEAQLPVIMKVLNHSDLKVTQRYLGIDQDVVCDMTSKMDLLHI